MSGYTMTEANAWTGRVLRRESDGLVYTVTSCSTYGNVSVWDPATEVLYRFDSRETFEHWLCGKPVAAAGPSNRALIRCTKCGGSGSLPDMTCCPVCGGGGIEVQR